MIVFALLLINGMNNFASSNDIIHEVEGGLYQDDGGYFELNDEYYRARVLSVENRESEFDFIELEQRAEVVIRSGPYRGERVFVDNLYAKNNFLYRCSLRRGNGCYTDG